MAGTQAFATSTGVANGVHTAYAIRDVDEVARVCRIAGLAEPVARLRPVGVVKG